jgi:hypothetical protein
MWWLAGYVLLAFLIAFLIWGERTKDGDGW